MAASAVMKQFAGFLLALGLGIIGLYLLLFSVPAPGKMTRDDIAYLEERYPGGHVNESGTQYIWCQRNIEVLIVFRPNGNFYENGRCWK